MARKKRKPKVHPDIKLLAAAGNFLFGPDWQRALSRELEINERTVRRWAKGEFRISPSVWPELDKLMKARVSDARHNGHLVEKRAKLAKRQIEAAEEAANWGASGP